MIYGSPNLEEVDLAVLALIEEQKEKLKYLVSTAPRRWQGSLRRYSEARAIRGSNSIEGYHASVAEALAIVDGEQPMDMKTETVLAITGYRRALTYILQASRDHYFELDKQFLKSLHFMMLSYSMEKNPGQWRPGQIFVVDTSTNQRVYEGPDVDLIEGLIAELVSYLKNPSPNEPLIIRAAMAHLNLAMIHPFSDGNGRMARALQTFVLTRGGTLSPSFCSIEEWLGENTKDYYEILAQTGQGKWQPERSALFWVRFCLKAHYQQAQTIIRRNQEYELLYNDVAAVIQTEKLPRRAEIPLFEAALGNVVTRSRYLKHEDGISDLTATNDLKKLCALGWLLPEGERRTRTYKASPKLAELRTKNRVSKNVEDPYVIAQKQLSLGLPSAS